MAAPTFWESSHSKVVAKEDRRSMNVLAERSLFGSENCGTFARPAVGRVIGSTGGLGTDAAADEVCCCSESDMSLEHEKRVRTGSRGCGFEEVNEL